jgi:hypothetical protein
MYRIWYTNLQFFAQGEYENTCAALCAGKRAGFDFIVFNSENTDKPIVGWKQFGGTTWYSEKDHQELS